MYRDLSRVDAIIEDCLAGQVEIVYQPGHPHGFVSSIYLAEVALCQPLWEADGQISALKMRALASTFPICPAQLQSRIEEAFTSLAADSRSIGKAIAVLEGLSRDMEVLVAREYNSRDP